MPKVKLIALIDRRRDLDLAAFSQHWRTTHRALIMRLVATGIIKGYVQNHRSEPQLDGLTLVGDGSPELWLESVTDMPRIRQSSEYMEGAYLDEPNFMEGRSRILVAEEHVVIPGPGQQAAAAGLKLMLFFKRTGAVAVTDGCLLMEGAVPLRVTRQVPIVGFSSPDAPPLYDLAEFSWWPDRTSLEAAWRERAAPSWIDADATCGMLVREEPCLWP